MTGVAVNYTGDCLDDHEFDETTGTCECESSSISMVFLSDMQSEKSRKEKSYVSGKKEHNICGEIRSGSGEKMELVIPSSFFFYLYLKCFISWIFSKFNIQL